MPPLKNSEEELAAQLICDDITLLFMWWTVELTQHERSKILSLLPRIKNRRLSAQLILLMAEHYPNGGITPPIT